MRQETQLHHRIEYLYAGRGNSQIAGQHHAKRAAGGSTIQDGNGQKLGFLPQPSDPERLTALVGPARAKLVLMGGAKIAAAEALQMGLVDRIAEAPLDTARDLAQDALQADRTHVGAIKEML